MDKNDLKEARPAGAASTSHIVLIMAGGSGLRAGGGVPKQMKEVGGKPMLLHSLEAFLEYDRDAEVIIVLNPECGAMLDALSETCPRLRSPRVHVCDGGNERLESVKKGLSFARKLMGGLTQDMYVAVHDAARPLVSSELIQRGWECAGSHGAAVPVVPLTDSIREVTGEGGSRTADRNCFRAVQTPQVVRADLLERAYQGELTAAMTDDASVCEAAGIRVAMYEGERSNIKVTNPEDFAIAEVLMEMKGK